MPSVRQSLWVGLYFYVSRCSFAQQRLPLLVTVCKQKHVMLLDGLHVYVSDVVLSCCSFVRSDAIDGNQTLRRRRSNLCMPGSDL